MGTHTVAEARDRLPELIERAREGEAVVITQDGTPVAEITPLREQVRRSRRLMQSDIDWLDEHRVPRKRMTIDSATLIREMRDESDL
jgi:prevent-host-death family protein